jgi:alkylation response protein AidB-like acyl-CoA dehydrogenase
MLTLTDEQRLLVDSTRRFLRATPRADTGAPAGPTAGEEAYWRRGAELGWTALVAEPGRTGQFLDLALLGREFGRAVAAGPFGPVNVVAAALARAGSAHQGEALSALVDGAAIATWIDGTGGLTGSGPGISAERAGSGYTLSGRIGPVEAACEAGFLLVSTRDARTFLVRADQPSVSVSPLRSLDLHRTYGTAVLKDVQVAAAALVGADPDPDLCAWLLDLAVLVQLAEIVGAMDWALDTTLKWTFDRYSFGRPLAAYQALQHRAADMKMWLEASSAILADAALAFETEAPRRSEVVSSAKAYIGRYGPELLHECVQFHGGIGVTAEHDLHLYLRRVSASVAAHGSAREHAIRVGQLVEAREGAQ